MNLFKRKIKNLTFFQVAFALVGKQTAVLTSEHGVHAPVGFHSGGMLPSYDKQRKGVLPPFAEKELFAFLTFELLRKLAEFDEAIQDDGSKIIGKHFYLELTLLCKAASSALLRTGWLGAFPMVIYSIGLSSTWLETLETLVIDGRWAIVECITSRWAL